MKQSTVLNQKNTTLTQSIYLLFIWLFVWKLSEESDTFDPNYMFLLLYIFLILPLF